MRIEISTLANGLRVVSHEMPHLETTSLGIWVGVGARDETEAQNGISHLLEHMAFKGTKTRSARDIAEEIEAVGGELNAATGPESTGYFARVLAGDEGVALEILADILLNSHFTNGELKREREVIIQEIAGVRDSPEEVAIDLLHEAAYPSQAVGRSILGTPASLGSIKTQQLKDFSRKHYAPDNMVLAAAGGVSHSAFLRHAEALFGGLSAQKRTDGEAAFYKGGTRAFAKPFEQCHLIIGFESPSYLDDQFYAAQVASGILGGGLSSRLFQEVREKRGLCYSVEFVGVGNEGHGHVRNSGGHGGQHHDEADGCDFRRAEGSWRQGADEGRDGACQGPDEGGAVDEPGEFVGSRRTDGAPTADVRQAVDHRRPGGACGRRHIQTSAGVRRACDHGRTVGRGGRGGQPFQRPRGLCSATRENVSGGPGTTWHSCGQASSRKGPSPLRGGASGCVRHT